MQTTNAGHRNFAIAFMGWRVRSRSDSAGVSLPLRPTKFATPIIVLEDTRRRHRLYQGKQPLYI